MVLPLSLDDSLCTPVPGVVDLTHLTVDLGAIRASIDSLAAGLSSMRQSTRATDGSCDIERVLGATQAVHQAAIALREDLVTPP